MWCESVFLGVQSLLQTWPGLRFDYLLRSVAAMHADDVHASFLFVGDLNGHHQYWLGSLTKNHHGVAGFDFTTVSGCVCRPDHACGGTLDLRITDVPDLVWFAVLAPIGYSDHSSLSMVISTAQAVPNLCVCRTVFPKYQVIWNTVFSATQDLPSRNIRSADNPDNISNEQLSLLVGRYVPTD